MRRLTRGIGLATALLALVIPAVAKAPTGWSAGSGVSGQLTVLRAVSAKAAIAGGLDGALLRTTDGGRTWSALTPPSAAAVIDVASPGGDTIFALDETGALWRSLDAGTSWSGLTPPGRVHPLALSALPGGVLLLAGRGAVERSTDNGDSFRQVTGGGPFAGVRATAHAVAAWGPHALTVSPDGGQSWKRAALPPFARGDSLLDTEFVTPVTGFVLTSFRELYRTDDAGVHWRDLFGTGGAGANVAFSDARHGWLSAPGFANRFDGDVLRTDDGGASWRPEPVASSFLSSVATGGTTTYAIGNQGVDLFANRGGAEPGERITVGFRPAPRTLRRGQTLTVRGRIVPAVRGAGVVVSMRSSGRWLIRYVHSDRNGLFVARFKPQKRAWVVAQVPAGSGHGSTATKAVFVPVVG